MGAAAFFGSYMVIILLLDTTYCREQADADNLLVWAAHSGAKGMENLKITCHENKDCTVHSMASFKKGEIVFSVPRNLTLEAPDGPEGDLDLNGQVQLKLLTEQVYGDKSPWEPYIRMLPNETSLTLSMSREDLGYLNGTQSQTDFELHRDVQEQQAKDLCVWARQHDAALPPGTEYHHFHLDACLWAVSMMKSRAFQVQSPKVDTLLKPTFIPIMDMMNHRSWAYEGGQDCTQTVNGVLHCAYKVPKDVAVGDELVITYGKGHASHLYPSHCHTFLTSVLPQQC